jgi:hypothetical protein
MYMVMLVLDDPNQLDALLEAWRKAGIGGATIIESTGIHRRQRQVIPLRYVFQTTGPREEGHYTLLAIVEGEQVVQNCLAATEALLGDLNQPNTGIFAAWPLYTVKGLPKSHADREG